ncbi:hypothetical protein [Rhodoferax fermentans]|uniref:Uncharacterized protein n=1 Tax=Rhodoferax fermentans TaxID=28066 RepID=A0A1T1ANR4_RHOFE|nr:hypothetical protein [Rhodoferax fermentans]OOV05780.1 hypothetical protein RF819_02810 [Rhodoferax fermentans]
MALDAELNSLARLAIRNAFWADFSALANHYIKLGAGLDTELLEMELGELTSIYGRNTKATGDEFINLWVQTTRGTNGHETVVEALKQEDALEVHLQGKLVFKRVKGMWFFQEKALG